MKPRHTWLASTSGVAAAWMIGMAPGVSRAQDVPVEPVATPEQVEEVTAPTRPNINPYDRDVAMTVPLHFNNRVLGELDVILTKDDRFQVNSESFITRISPLLTEEALAELVKELEGKTMFEAEEISESGIKLNYDPDLLAVLVLRIEPERRALERLFEDVDPEGKGLAPEPFSAYLNTNIGIAKDHSASRMSDPFVGQIGRAHV